MTLVRWSPFREFDDLFARPALASASDAARSWTPAADIFETATAYEIDLELPALNADDVEVNVRDGVLSVSGESTVRSRGEGEQAEARTHRRERRFGKFSRSFRLPQDADAEGISAQFTNGVLALTVPRRAEDRGRRVEVRVA